MSYRVTIFFLIIITIGLLVFSPILDTIIANAVYYPQTHQFMGEISTTCEVIYYLVPVITVLLIIIPFVVLWLSYYRKIKLTQAKARRFAVITLLSLAIGSGLLVNMVFKENWGRARPYQVLRDHEQYSKFWQPHSNRPLDNSFPSGHASIGFFLGVPLLALGYRKRALVVSIAGGAIIGGVRILQGGHYLSDVICAGIIVYLSTQLVVFIVNKYDPKNLN